MKTVNMFTVLNLQLFADGGDGGAVGEMGVGQNPTGNQGVDLATVQYGRSEEAQAPAEQNAEPAAVDLDAEFQELVKTKFKDQYNKSIHDAVDKRFKSKQAQLDAAAAQAPLIDRLASRYNLDASNIDALINAFDADDSLFEAEAMDKGLSVDQLRAMKKVEMENASMRRQMEEQAQKEGSERIYAEWINAAENLKQVYPNFDLNTELANPQFSQILMSGVDMKSAYEVVHLNDLVPSAMQFAAQQATEKVAKNMATNRARPRENGMNNQPGVMVRSDPSKLSNADLAEIERRVARGERISF